MTTFVNRAIAPSTYYRPNSYAPPVRPVADVRDDYERWYTETVPSNRMSLSLRSGILSDVGWALDRLCRLCHNEQFVFRSIPGVIDGLFDWPEWYVTEGYKAVTDADILFSPPPNHARQRRFALESLFVFRNAALHEQNAVELANHSHTVPLILNALHNLDFARDENSEALLHVIDIFHVVASTLVFDRSTPLKKNPIPPLIRIASQSTNRTLIIASLTALTAMFSNPSNVPLILSDSPALEASIRYLPLFIDLPLVDACLNYLYTHISNPPLARAFLLHSSMPSVLRVLINLILHQQQLLEERVTVDITGTIHTVPSTTVSTRDHELTKEELDDLLETTEPNRCYDWMRTMFVAKAEGELTQVDFWNLYKDAFSPYQEKYPLLVASDVIKNVNAVFPQAQAMVLQGPVQRFVVRGVDRRKETIVNERFKCQWNHSQCAAAPFPSPGDLFDHLLEHIAENEGSEHSCLWLTCPQTGLGKQRLRSHVLTHLSSTQPPSKHPSQSDTITLPSAESLYPIENPTQRPPPPPRSTIISYQRPTIDPPSTSLTALLVIRILFRTSFASAEAAPRVDADHFGFPGIVEDTGEQDDLGNRDLSGDEREGERRGRRAFIGITKLLESVQIRDEVLMGWVAEMVDAGMPSAN